MPAPRQKQQNEWFFQWQTFDRNEEVFLLQDWMAPTRFEDLKGLEVLEAGCGGGPHTALLVGHAKHVTAIDLNTTELARQRLKDATNVSFFEDDIAQMDLKKTFDVVMSIAVVHHTDDPDRTVANLMRHVKPGGKLILWVYAKEGNALVEYGVEPLRKAVLRHFPAKALLLLSKLITVLLYIPVYTVYLLPLPFLPYYAYFGNFRKLPFNRNYLNVFDKLNAPQVTFLDKKRVEGWLKSTDFDLEHISHYKGVSWRLTARRKNA